MNNINDSYHKLLYAKRDDAVKALRDLYGCGEIGDTVYNLMLYYFAIEKKGDD